MAIARFEHVSQAQYAQAIAACQDALPLAEIPLPTRATSGSAGYDYTATCTVTLQPGEAAVIPTGLRAQMEQGWVLMTFPRSSMGFKHGMRLANTVGIIDSDYYYAQNEGHIMIKIVNGGDHTLTIHAGERFAQGVFLPYGLAEEESVQTERSGGFGSTGK